MELTDLNDLERTVLIGLVKLIVHADRQVSPEERVVLGRLRDAFGSEEWNKLVVGAQSQFQTVEQLEQVARTMDRREAQILIHNVLVELAGSDEIIPEEAHVLYWVNSTWGVEEEEEEEEIDEDEGFDLIS